MPPDSVGTLRLRTPDPPLQNLKSDRLLSGLQEPDVRSMAAANAAA